MRPKRQAPPPPAGRAVSVEETEERDSRESPQGAAVMVSIIYDVCALTSRGNWYIQCICVCSCIIYYVSSHKVVPINMYVYCIYMYMYIHFEG